MSVGLDFNSLRPKCWTAERSSGLLHKFFPFRLKLLPEAFLLGTETPGSHTGGTPKEAVTPNSIVHGQGTKTISRNRVLSCKRDHSLDLFSQHPAQISTLWWDGRDGDGGNGRREGFSSPCNYLRAALRRSSPALSLPLLARTRSGIGGSLHLQNRTDGDWAAWVVPVENPYSLCKNARETGGSHPLHFFLAVRGLAIVNTVAA